MKRLFFVAIIATILMASCQHTSEKMQAQKDSLQRVLDAKDQSINEFVNSFNEIQSNLDSIKAKESIINVQAGGKVELDQSAKDKINADILSIYELALKNKKTIGALSKKLKKANMKIDEFEKMIASLNKQIAEKDDEIEKLKNQLSEHVLNIANLNTEIKKINSNLDKAEKEKEDRDRKIEAQTNEMNTVYYVFGTKKELKEHKVITTEGLFGGQKKLNEDFDKTYFTKADMRKLSGIPLFSKKAKVMTNHPPASYMFSGKDKIDSLVIKNSKDFWSVSRYLVIVVE